MIIRIIKGYLRYVWLGKRYGFQCWGWKKYKEWYLETVEWIGAHPERRMIR